MRTYFQTFLSPIENPLDQQPPNTLSPGIAQTGIALSTTRTVTKSLDIIELRNLYSSCRRTSPIQNQRTFCKNHQIQHAQTMPSPPPRSLGFHCAKRRNSLTGFKQLYHTIGMSCRTRARAREFSTACVSVRVGAAAVACRLPAHAAAGAGDVTPTSTTAPPVYRWQSWKAHVSGLHNRATASASNTIALPSLFVGVAVGFARA